MPTLPREPPETPQPKPHQSRQVAESFGTDPERYDRARPRYPDELIRRILDTAPGRYVLDVGCGTGIAARQLRDAGATVLGVEPDGRMAAFARTSGVDCEVATFEVWDPAGRRFDAVAAGQSWHWIDPAIGAAKAAEVLRPGGLLALFAHVFDPPAPVAEATAAALKRLVPDSPFAKLPPRSPLQMYQAMFDGFNDAIGGSGSFATPRLWRFDWEHSYTRDQWLDVLPTTGAFTRLAPDILHELLSAVATAIDAIGGQFTMPDTTLTLAAITS